VGTSGAIGSADLGNSSNHQARVRLVFVPTSTSRDASSPVVEKVSLRVALMQGLVGPKC